MFFTNQTIQFTKSGAMLRVVGQIDDDTLALYGLGKVGARLPAFKLVTKSIRNLLHSHSENALRIIDDPFSAALKPIVEILGKRSTAEDKETKRRQEVVEWVLEAATLSTLLSRKGRTCRMHEAAQKFGVPLKELQRWLPRFLTYGMSGGSLRPFHWKKGCFRKGTSTNKLGRPVRFHNRGLKGGVNVTPAIRAALYPFVKDYYKKIRREGGKPKRKDAYDAFLLVYYSVRVNGKVQLKPEGELMKFSSFKGIFHRDRHAVQMSRIMRRDRHDKDHREKLGSEAQRSLFAGNCYQGDFTIGDIELVHPIYREKCPVGQPLAGIVADVFSSASVGGHVAMTNGSGLQGLLLFENAFSDKTELFDRLKLDINAYPIPGGVIPNRIYVDNGELRGILKRVMPENLGIRFTNLPPGRCEHKGTIESAIGELLGEELRLLPGYRRRDRKGHRCAADGQLDPLAFFRILLLAMGFRNAGLIKDKYQGMATRRDMIPPSPIEMWRHSLKKISGKLRVTPPADMLRFLLLPRAMAKINGDGKGLVFEKEYYFNKMLLQSGTFMNARDAGTRSVPIAYDPRLVDVIYLIDDVNRSKIQPCFLSDRSHFLRNRSLSFADAKIIRTEGDYAFALNDTKTTPARIDYKLAVNDIVEEQKDKNRFALEILRSFAPVGKAPGRILAGKEESRDDARVLVDADSTNAVIVPFPSQNGVVSPVTQPNAVSAPVLSARERAVQAAYEKVVA